MLAKNISASYFRSFIFGVEDSLVSTVGLLSGVAIADVPRRTILLTGLVLIFVEAFSMAVGSFLSERSVEEYIEKKEIVRDQSFKVGMIMFFSYFLSGFIPLLPYMAIGGMFAFWISIVLSLAALFVLGMIGGKISGISSSKQGFRMFLIGGMAIAVGIVVGGAVNQF